MSTQQKTHPSQTFRMDKSTIGEITYLTLHGVLDEGFEGQKVAQAVRTQKLILSLRDVRRFASWGMAEWMNFLRATAENDLYLVECSTYAVSQMNLVTGLLGHGKLVSFYAAYRCGHCSEEFEQLVLVPTAHAGVADHGDKICATCGGNAQMDKYSATMYSTLSERPAFDLDDQVVAFLRSRLKYDLAPDLTRFRAFRRVNNGYTYLRLSGNMATLQADFLVKASEGTTVVDLAGVIFDPAEMTQWRTYVRTALTAVTSLQLVDCPPGFLDTAVVPEDLGKLKIRTFALPYHCPTCDTTTTPMVDVAQNLEQLIEGTVPVARCATCQSPMIAMEHPMLLRRLPARERDAALDKFLTKARGEPATKLEDCLVARAPKPAKGAASPARAIYLATVLGVLIIGGLAVVAVTLWKQRGETTPAARNPTTVVAPPTTQAFQRPDWIVSDVPSSAFCQDMINRLVCVGVSSYRTTRADAVADANDAALEELVTVVGLKISNPFFKDSVLAGYSEARAKALSALQAVDTDRASAAYLAADDVVRKTRRRVVESLQASGGAAVPAQRSDWYWEEYAIEKGSAGTEFLVFVRYDISIDAVKALVEKYSATTAIGGGVAMTAFPALAWEYGDFTGGAIVTKAGRPLTGIAPKQVVMAVGDQRIADASALSQRLEEWTHATGDLKVTVKPGNAPAQVIDIKR
jgi:DNA-directed RNA polymerase subunit RPC12/RpoP